MGYSEFSIDADRDLKDYLQSKLGPQHKGIENGKLRLPRNLCILATMNTSDQSLFPMDTAFKRRWDWEFVPINYEDGSSFTITIDEKKYPWLEFLKIVNDRIRHVTASEDKQMGNFFIKGDISEEEFKSKVMFYLWNEVCKNEYGTPNNFFRTASDTEFTFSQLYQTQAPKLQDFMRYLGARPQE